MAGRNYELSVRLRTAVEGLTEVAKLISEIDELGGATEESASKSKALSEEIRELQKADRLVQDFKDLKNEVRSTGDALDEAQGEAQRLGRELSESSQPTKQLERDFEKARKTVNRLKETQESQVRSLQNHRQELGKAGISSRDLADAQTKIRSSMDRTSREVDDLTSNLRQARDESAKEFKDPTDRLEKGARYSGQAVEGLGAKIKRVAGVAVGSAAAFFGIREAIQGIVGIVRVGADFEILQTRLEALTGSAEAGEEAFQWIQEFTKNTPFQLEQVTDAFVRAKAFGLDPMNGTLQAIADQAAKTGGGMEALNGIVTALGQAYSKGKIQAEEMLQLVERGVPAWDLLAKATGSSVEEVQKMTTAGKLGRREIGLLIDELGKAGAGAAQDQMSTLTGLVSNLQDQFKQFLKLVNEQGLLDYFKTQIKEISTALRDMRESGELEQWAKRISDSITGLVDILKSVAVNLYEYRDAIKAVATAWAAYKGAQLASGLFDMAGLLRRTAIPAMIDFGSKTKAATGRLGKFRAGLAAIPGPAKIIALAAAFLGLDKVILKGAESLGVWAAKLSGADDALEESRRRLRENAKANLEQLDAELAKLEQYRDARQVTADQAVRLSEEERAAYEEQLRGQEALLQTELRRGIQLQAMGVDVTESMNQVRESLEQTRASLSALEEGSNKAAQAMRSGISLAAQDLVDQFASLKSAGESAADAAAELFKGFDTSSVTSVREFVEAIGSIAEESTAAGEALDKELAKRLDDMTGDELRRFSISLRAAFDEGAEAASRFADLADQVADAALKNIGTSLQEIRTGISEMESAALDSFAAFTESGERSADEVRQAVEALQDEIGSPEAVNALQTLINTWASQSGQKVDEVNQAFNTLAQDVEGTAQQIAQQLSDAIKGAATEEDLAQVRERIKQAWGEGKISADQYSQALAEARDRQQALANDAEASGARTAAGMRQAAAAANELGESSASAAEKVQQAKEQAQGIGEVLGSFFDNTVARLEALGTKVANVFRDRWNTSQAAEGIDGIRSRIVSLEQEINDLESGVPTAGAIGRWMTDVAVSAREAELNFQRQRLEVERLAAEFEEGDYSASLMSLSVGELERRFDLLGDQDLAPLRSAINAVQGEVDGLNDSLASTLSSLRQELANLEGDSARVQELQFQERLLQLEEQLQRARELGDQEAVRRAREAIELLRQTHNLKLDNIRDEQQAEKQAEDERRQREQERRREELERQERQPEPQPAPQPAPQQQTRAQTVNLQLPGGQASLSGDPEDVNRLLEFLNDAGMRTTE